MTVSLSRETQGKAPHVSKWQAPTLPFLNSARARVRGYLPYADAEDLIAELIESDLAEGAATGHPGSVNLDHYTTGYLRWRALNFKRDHEAETEDIRDDDVSLVDETDGAGAPDETGADDYSASYLYRESADALRRLYIDVTPATVYALAAAISGLPSSQLAPMWGVSRAVWKRDAAQGAALIRTCYPGADGIRTAILRVIESQSVIRQTPEADRKVGAALPPDGRAARTPAQQAREADILIARKPMRGRKPTASKAHSGAFRIIAAPLDWQDARPYTLADFRADWIKAHPMAPTSAPRAGNRPHRAYSPGVIAAPKTYSHPEVVKAERMPARRWQTVLLADSTLPVRLCEPIAPAPGYPAFTGPALKTWAPGTIRKAPTLRAPAPTVPERLRMAERWGNVLITRRQYERALRTIGVAAPRTGAERRLAIALSLHQRSVDMFSYSLDDDQTEDSDRYGYEDGSL